MSLSTKIKKSLFILRHQGLKHLFRAIKSYLKKTTTPTVNPDETHLAFECLIKHFPTGLMIDVGAHHGSSLEPFADAGWQVVAFEPDKNNRAMLKAAFGKRPNIDIDARGLSNEEKSGVAFYTSTLSTGISGLSAFHETHQMSQTITITTLEKVLQEKDITQAHFLKIDTEGFDLAVLKGLNWEIIQPELIICEFEDRKTIPLGYTFDDLANYLCNKGYHLLISEWYPIIHYGGQHQWHSFKRYPCKLTDTKAWGNIIAVNKDIIFKDLLVIADQFQQKKNHHF